MDPLAHLRSASAAHHAVVLHGDEGFLAASVASWACGAFDRRGGALLIGTPEHLAQVRGMLEACGEPVASLEGAGRLLLVEAPRLLAAIAPRGEPDEAAFAAAVEPLLRRLVEACPPDAPLRAWGEMVDLLLRDRGVGAASRLEALWERRLDEGDFQLLCSYTGDALAPEAHDGLLEAIGATHAEFHTRAPLADLERAVEEGLVEVFGREAAHVHALFASRRPARLPAPLQILTALRAQHPELARRALEAARRRLRT